MVQVRVQRITSITEPETGRPGKQVELVEVKRRGMQNMLNMPTEEAKLIQGILGQFQSMGVLPIMRELMYPKLTLTLTEDEYDHLGVRFEVNDVYDLELQGEAIRFKRTTEGV
jgi:hypothetical protein